MNARYLIRYARYVLALLACVGFGARFNYSRYYSRRAHHERSSPVPLRPLCTRPARLCRLRHEVQLIQIAIPGGQTMNARYLFRYARYVLTVFSCVGFGRMIN